MIRPIESTSPFLTIQNQSSEYISSTSKSMCGMVRYENDHLEVYDGYTWLTIGNIPARIGLSDTAEKAIKWAADRMLIEEEILRHTDKFPAVKAAFENFAKAEKQLITTFLMCKNGNM